MFLSVFWYLSLVPWQFRCWYIWVIFEFLGTNAPTPLSTIKSFFAFLGGQLTPSLFNFWIISEAVFYCSAAVSINLRVKQLLAWLKCFSAVTSCRCSTGSHSGVDYGNMFPWKWYRYILLWAFTFLHILCYYFRYVMSWPWLHKILSQLLCWASWPPPGVQLLVEDEVVGLHSSEEVTLVAYSARCLLAPYFWGLRVLLAEREAARLSGA